jgi:S-adenosylhomocysteine hydrolase
MKNTVYTVPSEIDLSVANHALDAMNIKIDSMTDEQYMYHDELD